MITDREFEVNKNGVLLEPSATRNYDFNICCGDALPDIDDLPETFELPISEFSDVKNQYSLNTCVSFASAIIGECQYWKENNEKRRFSTGYMYGNEECRHGYMGNGMYADTAVKGLLKIGFVPATYYDFVDDMPAAYKMLKDRDDLLPIGQKMLPAVFFKFDDRDDETKALRLKQFLYKYRLPITGISTTYWAGSNHAFCIYGWDKNNVFKFQNSYGESYGSHGRSLMAIHHVDCAFSVIFDDIKLKYEDVSEDDWYYKPLKNSVLSGLVTGTSDTTFSPNDNIIRCDTAIILSRLLDKTDDSINSYLRSMKDISKNNVSYINFTTTAPSMPFKDVDDKAYYYKELSNIYDLKLMTGDENNNFNPDDNLTRAELATIAVRTYDYVLQAIRQHIPWASLTNTFGYDRSVNGTYDDVHEDDWYYHYVCMATQLGIMNGDTGFRPEDDITRAEATVVFERLFAKIDRILRACARA